MKYILCRTIHSIGFTRQELKNVALQQSEEKCRDSDLLAEMAFLNPNMFVWMDETGSDYCNNIHHYGYSLKGITPELTTNYIEKEIEYQ